MKPITAYCNQKVEGWDTFSVLPDQLCFVKPDEGIQITTDIKDLGRLKVIHVSIAPLPTTDNPPTVSELYERTPELLQTFFGDRGFAMQPLDERRPEMRHYFSILKEEEE